MLLRNIRAFGNFKPGDEVEVPDGAIFDRSHFEEAADVEDDEDQDEEGNKE